MLVCLLCRVNLALAYTELTEELGRVRTLAANQTEILSKVSQEQIPPGQSDSQSQAPPISHL